MKFPSFMAAWDVAQKTYGLKPVDLFILNQIFCAPNNSTTIMAVVSNPTCGMSRVTMHTHVKKLCKEGFLTKTEDQKNMRLKNLEPGEKFVEFLRKLTEIEP